MFKSDENSVKEKLSAKRKSLNLSFSEKYPNVTLADGSLVDGGAITGDKTVWILVMGDPSSAVKN